MTGSDLRATAEACAAFLTGVADADWSVAVPGLEMTVAGAVAHAAESCLWYAIDLAAAGADLKPVEHRVQPEHPPLELVATLRTYAEVAASVIDLAAPSARGFHPMGAADPSGFAAIGCDELLVHTDDAARGLGVPFVPPSALVEPVLRRLFPWVEVDDDPWTLLRWANGRIAPGARARLTRWRWHCAPLADWDGVRPPEIV